MNDILDFINTLDLDETAVKKSITFANKSAAQRGKHHGNLPSKGVPRPDTAARLLGKKRPASVGEKVRAARTGTKASESTKQKLTEAHLARGRREAMEKHLENAPLYWHALRNPVKSVLSGAVKVKPTMDAHGIDIPTFSIWMHKTMRISLDDLVKLANECETGEIFRDKLTPVTTA